MGIVTSFPARPDDLVRHFAHAYAPLTGGDVLAIARKPDAERADMFTGIVNQVMVRFNSPLESESVRYGLFRNLQSSFMNASARLANNRDPEQDVADDLHRTLERELKYLNVMVKRRPEYFAGSLMFERQA